MEQLKVVDGTTKSFKQIAKHEKDGTVLSEELVVLIAKTIAPYLKEGVNPFEVVKQVEAAVVHNGIRKTAKRIASWLMNE